ncbi:MAG: hypothetical protein JXA87_04180 [Thermoleophilia bacterium]|nr:hypothetical protein [Thermoleophilia bacterium]
MSATDGRVLLALAGLAILLAGLPSPVMAADSPATESTGRFGPGIYASPTGASNPTTVLYDETAGSEPEFYDGSFMEPIVRGVIIGLAALFLLGALAGAGVYLVRRRRSG